MMLELTEHLIPRFCSLIHDHRHRRSRSAFIICYSRINTVLLQQKINSFISQMACCIMKQGSAFFICYIYIKMLQPRFETWHVISHGGNKQIF